MPDYPKNRAPRYKVAKPAIIRFGEGKSVECLVRSLSETGAGMDVGNGALAIPGKFELLIPGDELSLPCRVVWRRDHKMGVAFIKSKAA